MATKNRERCKRRATEELPTRSIEHLAKLAVLDHRDDLKLHEVAPHQRELRERPTSSLSSRSKPPLKSAAVHRPSNLAPFGDRPPVALNRPIASSRALVSGFKEKVSMNFIVLSHFLCVGPACQNPRAQVRASPHVGRILEATRERAPDPRLRKCKEASSPGNIPLLKTFSRCGILTGGSKRCCLAFSVIPSGGGSFTPR
jgi:hypothetical protein